MLRRLMCQPHRKQGRSQLMLRYRAVLEPLFGGRPSRAGPLLPPPSAERVQLLRLLAPSPAKADPGPRRTPRPSSRLAAAKWLHFCQPSRP
mmetsp:Transcript_40566/g.126556  ORF Transcript_40566/g.126556 Transcript_40566/m.126556 type:complete len:91 (-) Transcript_40566:711-983(-)